MMGPAGAVVVLPPPVAAPAAAAAPAAGAGARLLAWNPLRARLVLAAALFVLGCAAAALACFAITTLPRADDSRLLGSCAPPTDEEAADMRAASEKLLLAASSQVLAGTAALLVPAWPVAVFGCVLAWLTSYAAADVLWMLVACHDQAHHGVLAFHFLVFYILRFVVVAVGVVVSMTPSDLEVFH